MKLMNAYPRISDLEAKAKQRIPKFAWAYLHSGTGQNRLRDKNQEAFEAIQLTPRVLAGRVVPDLKTHILGQAFSMPVGIAPVGLTTMIWPGSEKMCARAARDAEVPMTLSTVAGETIETIGRIADGYGWFQLYPPRDKDVRDDLIKRAADAGYKTLMVTVDVPSPSRREDMGKAGAIVGSRSKTGITPRILWQTMQCPAWSFSMLNAGGRLRFKTLERYADNNQLSDISAYIGEQLNAGSDWQAIEEIRALWKGPMLVKGVLHPDDAKALIDKGVDGLVISNHGGRQLDGAPTSLQQLPVIRKAVGSDVFLAFDSGVRSGLDVVRALAMGADFVMMGRPFLYGAGAVGSAGPGHVLDIVRDEITNVMIQLGVRQPSELPAYLTDNAKG